MTVAVGVNGFNSTDIYPNGDNGYTVFGFDDVPRYAGAGSGETCSIRYPRADGNRYECYRTEDVRLS